MKPDNNKNTNINKGKQNCDILTKRIEKSIPAKDCIYYHDSEFPDVSDIELDL